MEIKELSQEESDAKILEEMWLTTEDDSTTNDEVEESETEEKETEEEDIPEEVENEEVEEEEPEEEQEEIKEEKPSKKPNWFKKVLSQRNEARKEAEDAKSQVQELQEKLDKLSEDWDYWNEEYVQTLVEKKLAERDEKDDFFETNPEVTEYKKEIIAFAKETWLSLDRSTKLYLAENNPNLLLEDTDISKKKSKIFKAPMQTSKKVSKWTYDYSDAEFDKMAKAWKITF